MISMNIINQIMLIFGNVLRVRRMNTFICFFYIFCAILLQEFFNERIRTSCIIRSIGKCNDILITTNRESFDITHFINVFLCQFPRFHN